MYKIKDLQRYVNLKKIEQSICKFTELDIRNKSETLSFDEFSRIILGKNVIKNTDILLTSINKIFKGPKVNPRILLSSYIISGHSKIVFERKNDLENKLYNASLNLVSEIERLCTRVSYFRLYKLKIIFNEYSMLFKIWEKIDSIELVEMLMARYYNIEKTIHMIVHSNFENQQKTDFILDYKEQQQTLKNNISKLDNNFDFKILDKYISIHKQVEKTYKKAFWDTVEGEIKRDDYSNIVTHVNDIVALLCDLTPNRKDIQQELKDKFDNEILSQLIESKKFSTTTLFEYLQVIFDQMKKLCSANMEKDIEKMWNDLIEEIGTTDYHILIPKTFRIIYNIIDDIKKDLQLFYLMQQQIEK